MTENSGLFSAEVDFPNGQTSYFRIVQGTGATGITPICYSFIFNP